MKPTFTQVSIWITEIEQLTEKAEFTGRNTEGLKRIRNELEVLKREVLKEFKGKQEPADLVIQLS